MIVLRTMEFKVIIKHIVMVSIITYIVVWKEGSRY